MNFAEGRVGSLVDGKGLFFKPLQGDERGEREVAFYQRFWQDDSVPASIKSFFPKFYGVKELPAVGPVDKLNHAALEDLTHSYVHPSIVDVKVSFCPSKVFDYLAFDLFNRHNCKPRLTSVLARITCWKEETRIRLA